MLCCSFSNLVLQERKWNQIKRQWEGTERCPCMLQIKFAHKMEQAYTALLEHRDKNYVNKVTRQLHVQHFA